jgi:hypothetical protein
MESRLAFAISSPYYGFLLKPGENILRTPSTGKQNTGGRIRDYAIAAGWRWLAR